jgi:SOS-response transcriptional repressor LexA
MLTHMQLKLLRYIEAYIAEHDVSPTYREMAEFLGSSSTSGPFVMVRRMIKLGRLSVDPSQGRSLRIIKPPTPNLKQAYDRGFRSGTAAAASRKA